MTDARATPALGVARRWPLLVAPLIVAAVLVVGAALWLRGPLAPFGSPAVSPGPSPAVSEFGSNQPAPLEVTGVFIEPGDGRWPLLDEIDAARTSIDVAVYLISDEIVLGALEDARRRGVSVRVILEEHPFGGAGGQEAIFARLEEAGIAVRWGNSVFRFTQMKRTGSRAMNL